MFGQKFINTNKMLQCTCLHRADFVAAELAQLNTAEAVFEIGVIGCRPRPDISMCSTVMCLSPSTVWSLDFAHCS
jgi:hypothetical protein